MLDDTEKIYKSQIEELIMKNYQSINQKNMEIAELDSNLQQMEN